MRIRWELEDARRSERERAADGSIDRRRARHIMALRRVFALGAGRNFARTFTSKNPFDAQGAEVDALRVELASACDAAVARGDKLNWVFLGAPGVGKGTYSSRVAKLMGVPHIATGDLVRAEIKAGTERGKEMQRLSGSGKLVPFELVMDLLSTRIERGASEGERGFLLDGFPRTVPQAEALGAMVDVTRAMNLTLREDILVEKCCGRRECGECGKSFNIADIKSVVPGQPTIIMPPLNPPEKCLSKLTQRSDDTEEVVKRRLEVYKNQTVPVIDFYRQKGVLSEFAIMGGIPETTPLLLKRMIDILNERAPKSKSKSKHGGGCC